MGKIWGGQYEEDKGIDPNTDKLSRIKLVDQQFNTKAMRQMIKYQWGVDRVKNETQNSYYKLPTQRGSTFKQ